MDLYIVLIKKRDGVANREAKHSKTNKKNLVLGESGEGNAPEPQCGRVNPHSPKHKLLCQVVVVISAAINLFFFATPAKRLRHSLSPPHLIR